MLLCKIICHCHVIQEHLTGPGLKNLKGYSASIDPNTAQSIQGWPTSGGHGPVATPPACVDHVERRPFLGLKACGCLNLTTMPSKRNCMQTVHTKQPTPLYAADCTNLQLKEHNPRQVLALWL